jgi:hypothetical protein
MFTELHLPFIICQLGSSQGVCSPGIVKSGTLQCVVPIRRRQVIKTGLLQQGFQSEAFVTTLHFETSSICVRTSAGPDRSARASMQRDEVQALQRAPPSWALVRVYKQKELDNPEFRTWGYFEPSFCCRQAISSCPAYLA